jgi:hypothetical protein
MFKVDRNLDIDKFLDDCFQFVVEQSGSNNASIGSVAPISKGALRHENRVAKLQQHLQKTKQQVFKVSYFLSFNS